MNAIKMLTACMRLQVGDGAGILDLCPSCWGDKPTYRYRCITCDIRLELNGR